jgi:hypothetical protein
MALGVAGFFAILALAMLAYDYNFVPVTVRQTGERPVVCEEQDTMVVPWRIVSKPKTRRVEQLYIQGRWQDCDRDSCKTLEELYCSLINK